MGHSSAASPSWRRNLRFAAVAIVPIVADAVLTKPFPMDCLLDLVATIGAAERAAI